MPRRRWLIAAIAVLVVIALGLTIYFLVRAPRLLARHAVRKTETRVDLATLVTQIRELSRLETASMRVMHVSTVTQSYGVIPNQIAGDQLTFLAVGDVVAGVDLSLLREQDVKRTADGGLILDLPPPQILVTRLDNRESRVIDRDTGVLRRPDVHLESRVRSQAEAAIRNEALRKGVLTMAEQNAERKVAQFLHKIGFPQIRFEHREAEPRL